MLKVGRSERKAAMLNFIEIMRTAQGGDAIANMAGRFGLSPEQTTKAVAALLPAFAIGFQQAAARPDQLAPFAETMRRGVYEPFFESAAKAFTADAAKRGEEALAALFGSPELARSLAEQGAALAGLSQDTMKQMMPFVASTLMGGMAKSMTESMASPPQAPDFMRAFAAFTPGAPPSTPPKSQTPDNPYEAFFSAMLGVKPEAPPRSDAEKAVEQAFDNWNTMLAIGRNVQDAQMQAMRAFFENAAKNLERKD
ncbi:MAG: DUF937 domain-containing protein [Salinarimonadaceae bacterium]|nr:MAG: DUF937 domain-containing protein [Salinarimonadaceae bacterium]